jgi:hypothetical protein
LRKPNPGLLSAPFCPSGWFGLDRNGLLSKKKTSPSEKEERTHLTLIFLFFSVLPLSRKIIGKHPHYNKKKRIINPRVRSS